ncbi:hypothetical protein RCH07_003940 [Arthrobacter sp. CG_A4]|nr:hypothetical protein [Arthrobacter sp. CG_A4]
MIAHSAVIGRLCTKGNYYSVETQPAVDYGRLPGISNTILFQYGTAGASEVGLWSSALRGGVL